MQICGACVNVMSRACVSIGAGFKDVRTSHVTPAVLDVHLHVWETEVKVAETKQTAFPLVTGAAAVALRPGRFGAGPSSAHLLQSVVSPVNPGAPHPVHTTVLIRLIGLDLELPPVPVAPAPVTCGPC